MVNKLLDSKLLFIGILFLSLNSLEVWCLLPSSTSQHEILSTSLPYKPYLFDCAIKSSDAPLSEAELKELDDLRINSDNINAIYKLGRTALSVACGSCKFFLVEWLLKNGADPLIANEDGLNSLDIVNKYILQNQLSGQNQDLIPRLKQIKKLLEQKIAENASKKA